MSGAHRKIRHREQMVRAEQKGPDAVLDCGCTIRLTKVQRKNATGQRRVEVACGRHRRTSRVRQLLTV